MENIASSKTLADYLSIIRRRYKFVAMASVICFMFFASIVFMLPSIYLSSATILIEQQEISQDFVKSTISSIADQRLQIINQRVMTRNNLLELIKKYDLYASARERQPLEDIVDQMRDDIDMETISADIVDPRYGRPTQATIAFKLSYKNSSPQLAQQVTNELVTLFMNENLKSRSQTVSQAADFLTDETEKLNQTITELSSKLAQYKADNANQLPENSSLYSQVVERSEQQLIDVDRELRSLTEQKIYLESELSRIDPNSEMFTENGERILSPSDRLKMLETKYLSMSGIYSENHPDMQRMRREIAALKTQTGGTDSRTEMQTKIAELEADLQNKQLRYAPGHPDVVRLQKLIDHLKAKLTTLPVYSTPTRPSEPDNPAYIKLQAQLEAAQSQIRSLGVKKAELRKKIADYEERLTSMPLVEKEMSALQREYDNARARYQELKAKQMEAKLAESLESGRKGERFTLIESPDLPQEPAKPNRPALLLLALIAALALPLWMAATLEMFDQSIRSDKDVIDILDMPPIGKIPYISTDAETLAQKRRMIIYATAGIGVVFIGILTVHFAYKPLDVLWYIALHKAGIS